MNLSVFLKTSSSRSHAQLMRSNLKRLMWKRVLVDKFPKGVVFSRRSWHYRLESKVWILWFSFDDLTLERIFELQNICRPFLGQVSEIKLHASFSLSHFCFREPTSSFRMTTPETVRAFRFSSASSSLKQKNCPLKSASLSK